MTQRNLLADSLAWLNVTGLAILVGSTVFQMMVIVPEYNRDLPRGMMDPANTHVLPANFWTSAVARVVEVVPFVALALDWKTARTPP